jgi:hypothetical protein
MRFVDESAVCGTSASGTEECDSVEAHRGGCNITENFRTLLVFHPWVFGPRLGVCWRRDCQVLDVEIESHTAA